MTRLRFSGQDLGEFGLNAEGTCRVPVTPLGGVERDLPSELSHWGVTHDAWHKFVSDCNKDMYDLWDDTTSPLTHRRALEDFGPPREGTFIASVCCLQANLHCKC